MIEFRKQIKELVTYILNPEERDEDVIENYTDTVMLACEEYHIKQLKLYGVVGQSEQYFCCKDQIKQRCNEQCLGCFQFENKD